MAYKPKKGKVRKVASVTPERKKSQKPQAESVSRTAEQLVLYNGNLVEVLQESPCWKELVEPLIEEMISGVSGRKTNGRYYHGSLTKDVTGQTGFFIAGYQKALMDLYNSIDDFKRAKDNLLVKQKEAFTNKQEVYINPFLEEYNEEG